MLSVTLASIVLGLTRQCLSSKYAHANRLKSLFAIMSSVLSMRCVFKSEE